MRRSHSCRLQDWNNESFNRQVASKARHNKQQQSGSTSSLSAYEKLSCGFRVLVMIIKVCAAHSLTFTAVSGPRGGSAQPRTDRVKMF